MTHNVMTNIDNTTINCLDHGFVRLVDVMPSLVPEETKTADFAVVQAARVSYGSGTKTINEDRGLIRYLMRHQHTTPFEMIEFKFDCKMPIFVARQWIRHRTANVNEYSGRYSIIEDDFYIPSINNVRQQSKNNKQGGIELINEQDSQNFITNLDQLCIKAYSEYEEAIDKGVAKEIARMNLPVNIYTRWYWKIDLHNLFHFLALRCDSHAQMEIRVFAEAMLSLIQPIVPLCVEAWNDYHPMRGGMRLTRLELDALYRFITNPSPDTACILNTDNKREQEEWDNKLKRICNL